MRQFTTSQSFHDNDGNLLHGRIKFYNAHESTLADIYNSDGQVITNPIFTNNVGQTVQQVFLGDIDYRIEFEKYIGSGSMESDVNPANWVFQYSSINLYDTFAVDINSKALPLVDVISNLRTMDPIVVAEQNGIKMVQLAGYYNVGDKPVVTYYWDETSLASDNGGSVIKVNSIATGRWILVTNQIDYVDVRHFGAMPVNSIANLSTNQANAILQANMYAISLNIPTYLPSSIQGGTSIYLINRNLYNAIFDQYSTVVVENDKDIVVTLEPGHDYFHLWQCKKYVSGSETDIVYNGKVTLTGDNLEYGCCAGRGGVTFDYSKIMFTPRYSMKINHDVMYELPLSNVDVYFTSSSYKSADNTAKYPKLTNCRIISNKAIGKDMHVSFTNCAINENMFSSDNMVSNYSFTNCYSTVDEWQDVEKYINFWKRNGENVLDLHSRSLTRNVVVSDIGDVLTIRNVGYSSNGKITLSDEITTLYAYDSSTTIQSGTTISVGIQNSILNLTAQVYKSIFGHLGQITFTNSASTVTVSDINLSDGYLKTSNADTKVMVTGSITLLRGGVECKLGLLQASSVGFTNTNITGNIETYKLDMIGCTVNASIYQYDQNGAIVFNISNCRFEANGYHRIGAVNGTNVKVNGRWCNNVAISSAGSFVIMDRTNFDPKEKNHNYVYENNSGTGAIQVDQSWTETMSYYSVGGIFNCTAPRQFFVGTTGSSGLGTYKYVFRGSSNMINKEITYVNPQGVVVTGGTTDPDIYATEFRMFTVGTDLEGVNLFVTGALGSKMLTLGATVWIPESEAITTVPNQNEKPWHTTEVGIPKNIMFSNGYAWRLYALPIGIPDGMFQSLTTYITNLDFVFNVKLVK